MYAKEEWVAGRVDEARSVLDRAHQLNAASEEVWLAAMKIEFECGEYERARALLTHARDKCRSARVWMKSAKLERVLGERARERELLDDGLKRWKEEWKLWLMKAQWLQRSEPLDAEAVRDTYKQAVKHCPTVAVLWVEYAKYEMSLVSQPSAGISQSSALARARAILEDGAVEDAKESVALAHHYASGDCRTDDRRCLHLRLHPLAGPCTTGVSHERPAPRGRHPLLSPSSAPQCIPRSAQTLYGRRGSVRGRSTTAVE